MNESANEKVNNEVQRKGSAEYLRFSTKRKHKYRLSKRSTSTSSISSSECAKRTKRKKTKKKVSKKRRHSSSSTSSSSTTSNSDSETSSTSSEEELKKKKHKLKKLKRKLKKCKEQKKEKQKKSKRTKDNNDVPVELMDKSKVMAPMTKEEWEKKQSIVKRVYDEESGRHRLVKGDGEVIEEIVSKDRHKAINRQATQGDGNFFQSKMLSSLKR